MLLRLRHALIALPFTLLMGGFAAYSQAPAVATGDSRTVVEPSFPSVCATLTASMTSVSDDIPASVDATSTNPDGARIQGALTGCASTNQAVRLSTDGATHNAFLTGPLNMPSGVTLLVDPGVFVYFSRNVQDYDVVAGTHTCGTVNSASATSSCLPLININGVSNVGIMGFGKLDGRGGDTLLNAFPSSYAGQSWWGLSAIANSGGSQQNPRFIQVSNATNVTLYKITLKNSPLFHVSGSYNGLTAWDVKIVTPTTARNTDGIDPDQAQNVTITRSWISDGDDNVAVGASGSASSNSVNISVTNNHFFAGHGESIGSYTSAGVNNVLFDSNMSAGNSSVDSNSTGIRIKSANDRGGVVQNIQYSNSCYQNHKAEIQFTPLYNTNTGTLTPNFKNILMQNLTFLTEGTVQFTGASNNGTVNPLTVTLDNVGFATVSTSDFSVAPTNAALTFGPGQVSTNFVNAYKTYVGANGNTLSDVRTASSLVPPVCSFTFIAPELTGPTGLPQTVISGQTATAIVILTPAVGGSAYPTGTVTLTDGSGSTSTATLPGTGDTISIPLSNLSVGTHTFTATYTGDSNYVPTSPATIYSTTSPYVIIVNAGTLGTSSTTLSGVPASTTYGTPFTLTATVTGSSPTGNVQFVVNGSTYAMAPLASGSAQATLSLPLGSYTISAVYSGDSVNAGSVSSSAPLTVSAAATTTSLTSNTTTTTGGVPVQFTATVASSAGTPTGTVNFTYTVAPGTTPSAPISAALTNGVAIASLNLPTGSDSVTATYVASGNYAGSASSPALVITVGAPVSIPLSSSPLALPYTISTIGGSSLASTANTSCAGSVDSFGDGCAATAITLNVGTQDLRSVVADPYGNLYFTDANASLVRRISASGIVTNFAGRVTGTACVPTATVGCTPTLVALNKPRGISTDAKGNLYIAGYGDSKTYEVSAATGLLYLVAGTGTKGTPGATNGNGGVATAALLDQPRGIWADTIGNIYIADSADNQIRVVSSTGSIQAFAGAGTASSTGDGGVATAANVNNPQGVLTDLSDNVYIAEASKIRVVCVTCASGSGLYQLLKAVGVASPTNNNIYTLAGGGAAYTGSAPVLATSVTMSPQKIAIDANSNLYISDSSTNVIWFLDSHTGYIRIIAGGATATTTCNGSAASVGDGCHATQANIGSNSGNGLGIGNDVLGNIYISDTTNFRIRKVSTNLQFPTTADAATTTQPVNFHFIANDTPASSNAFAYTSPEWSLTTPTCTKNSDTTDDCLLSANFTPAVPGARATPLTVTSSLGNAAALGLSGTGNGAGATLDPASQFSFGSNLQVKGLATDNTGNVYVSDATSKSLLRFSPASIALGTNATSATLATLTAPGATAVDSKGYAYVADTSTGLITQVTPSGVSSTLPFKFTTPAGLAVDALNNLYVSDSAAKAIYEVSPYTGAQRTIAAGTLSSPAGLVIDPSGNLIIADTGAAAVYRLNLQTNVRTAVATPAVAPSGIATDAAGNLLVADEASLIAVPKSTNSAAFTIAPVTPSAIAVDSSGNLYTGANSGVVELKRTVGSLVFANGGISQSASFLASGTLPVQLPSVSQSDTIDYTLTAAASTDCSVSAGLPSTVATGGACTLTANYAPKTTSNTIDTVTFAGNVANASLSTPSTVQLLLTGSGATPPVGNLELAVDAYTSSSTVSGADPIYIRGWVADPVDGSPMSNVKVYIDSVSVGTPTLGISRPDVASGTGNSTYGSSGFTLVTPASGLSAGAHAVTVVAIDTAGLSTTLGPLSITVNPVYAAPTGNLDQAVDSLTSSTTVAQSDSLYVSGWAADPLDGSPLPNVKVYIDGGLSGTPTTGISRQDVAVSTGKSSYANSGFTYVIPASGLSIGTHAVSVVATNSHGISTTFGPISITVTAGTKPPAGHLDIAVDSVTGNDPVSVGDSTYVQGWAADYQANGPVQSIAVYIDGVAAAGTATLGQSRPDVASAYNDSGWSNVGWYFVIPAGTVSSGTHNVTAVATDSQGFKTTLGPLSILFQ